MWVARGSFPIRFSSPLLPLSSLPCPPLSPTLLVKFDVQSESYRAAAVEYRLLSTRITAILRREENDNEKWDSLWTEIEVGHGHLFRRIIPPKPQNDSLSSSSHARMCPCGVRVLRKS